MGRILNPDTQPAFAVVPFDVVPLNDLPEDTDVVDPFPFPEEYGVDVRVAMDDFHVMQVVLNQAPLLPNGSNDRAQVSYEVRLIAETPALFIDRALVAARGHWESKGWHC